MRQKSENEKRDRYSRHYAAVLAVDAMLQFRSRGIATVLIIEAEDDALWDDIVQIDEAKGKHHRHQVKRQQTDLDEESFAQYVVAAANGNPDVDYHFAFPVYIEVAGAGEIRVLRGLCERIQQEGASQDKVLDNLRDAERTWVDHIKKWSGLKEADAFALLRRIHVDIIQFEDDLDRLALRFLEPIYSHRTEEAWARIQNYISSVDGVVEIHPRTLLEIMPTPAADDIDTFYWSFIEEVESRFFLRDWEWLTDHLVRNLMHVNFHDNAWAFIGSVRSAHWPDCTCPSMPPSPILHAGLKTI